MTAPAAPPAPDGRSPAAYGTALGVPPVDPWNVAALHPFHLLRDRLDVVHRLATRRVTTLAAAERLLADEAHAEHAATPEERAVLAARASAARAWSDAWRVGRGRPVDRAALEASNAVTATFLDEVDALAREVDGDAGSLLDALAEGRVRFFRDAARDRLEGYLREAGHLDGRRPLDEGERIVALDRALTRAGGGDVAPATLTAWLEGGRKRDKDGAEPVGGDGAPAADDDAPAESS